MSALLLDLVDALGAVSPQSAALVALLAPFADAVPAVAAVLVDAGVSVGNVLASSDEGSPAWLLAAGPAAGGGIYWTLFRYYRNTDKSHQFERETIIESQPVQGSDVKVDEVRGTKRSRIDGDNGSNYRQRVQRVR
ncbi:hypothetical protein [Leucobacter sp. gxy201]|uniref:hypothetical protein n=1 Tax=Leucobacter sp. gxy201 TaxID=2957200 RepID=UPI003DA1837C